MPIEARPLEPAIAIDPRTGAICLGTDIRLEPFQSRRAIEPLVADLIVQRQDHGNGYEWLYLGGLGFGGHPASLSLCFHGGRLERASWNVMLPGAPLQDGWPTQEAIDAEVDFVRTLLAREGLALDGGSRSCAWGSLWSEYDPRAGLASHGLRYLR